MATAEVLTEASRIEGDWRDTNGNEAILHIEP